MTPNASLRTLPQASWSDEDKLNFLRDVQTRIRYGSFTWDPPNLLATSTVDAKFT